MAGRTDPDAGRRKPRRSAGKRKSPARNRARLDQRDDAYASSSAVRPRVTFGSTGTPGPMVVENVTFFR